MSIIQKSYSIEEVIPEQKETPVYNIRVSGEEVLTVNTDCSWEVDRVFVDNVVGVEHEVLVVVFRRKKEGE